MIICANCAHPNPDTATECEACYTPLTASTRCPNCGVPVLTTAEFCGQCGLVLHPSGSVETALPPTQIHQAAAASHPGASLPHASTGEPRSPAAFAQPGQAVPSSAAVPVAANDPHKTQLQQLAPRLLHLQTNTTLELPAQLTLIHIGKPNSRIPPDLDVSGFPDSDVVSRIHAHIRVEGDAYFIEDANSSNGTYINNLPLLPGDRHRLRPSDRIALGKGDKVTFLFQI